MSVVLTILIAASGGAWRRWLGAGNSGPRSVKVVVGFFAGFILFVALRQDWNVLGTAFSAACAGALILPFVMALDWHNLKWPAARWALSALPLAGLLGIDRHFIGAGLAPIFAAAAGLSWATLSRVPFVAYAYTLYAEILAGMILWGFVAGVFLF